MGVEKMRRPLLLAAGRRYGDRDIAALKQALGIGDLLARLDALEAQGGISLLGAAAALNLAAARAHDTGIDWPDAIADRDLYIVAGDVNGRVAQIVQGIQISGIDAGAAEAALGDAAAIPLYPVDVTGAAALARLGRSAAGDVLLHPAAADADASLAIFRVAA